MANWYGSARSNYVKIKDVDGLKKALEPFDIQMWENDGFWAFGGDEDSGGWPGWGTVYITTTDEYGVDGEEPQDVEFDPRKHICPFMEDDQVLIMMQCGAEKLRYITGNAEAYHANGEWTGINLADIYREAQEAWPDANITEAKY